MPSFEEQVREFHQRFEVPVLTKPTIPPTDRKALRIELIEEEFKELKEALENDDLELIADAICDLHYVISGTALEYGIPEELCFEEVHRSNMSKAHLDGSVTRSPSGKIIKAPTYSPANLKPILGL